MTETETVEVADVAVEAKEEVKLAKDHVLLTEIQRIHEALSLLELEDVKDTKGEERVLNITSKLEFQIIWRLTRSKDKCDSILKLIKRKKKQLQDKFVIEKDKEGNPKVINAVALQDAIDAYLDDPKNAVEFIMPEIKVSAFIHKEKFFVPMRFLTLMGKYLVNDEKKLKVALEND